MKKFNEFVNEAKKEKSGYEEDLERLVKGWNNIPQEDRDVIVRYVLHLVHGHDNLLKKALGR